MTFELRNRSSRCGAGRAVAQDGHPLRVIFNREETRVGASADGAEAYGVVGAAFSSQSFVLLRSAVSKPSSNW